MQKTMKIVQKISGLVHHLYRTNISTKTTVQIVRKSDGCVSQLMKSLTGSGGKVNPPPAAAMRSNPTISRSLKCEFHHGGTETRRRARAFDAASVSLCLR